jgi:exodeoxyribonuclease-3
MERGGLLGRGTEPVLTRRSLPGDPADQQSRYIEAAVNGVLIACIYLPNGNPQPGPKFDYKLAWFERLIAHAATLFILAGDFNVVPTDFDIYRTRSWLKNALLQPVPQACYQRLLEQGWTDALRTLHRPIRCIPSGSISETRGHGTRACGWIICCLIARGRHACRRAGVDRDVRGEQGASDHAPAWVRLKRAGGTR